MANAQGKRPGANKHRLAARGKITVSFKMADVSHQPNQDNTKYNQVCSTQKSRYIF